MVLVFDLDDTLYPEITYVKSGFMAVAEWGEKKFKIDKHTSYANLLQILEENGRGQVFDLWLKKKSMLKMQFRYIGNINQIYNFHLRRKSY